MKILKQKTLNRLALAVAILLMTIGLVACKAEQNVVKEPAGEEYVYFNPDETKAKTDEGMKIDGVLDEAVYSEKNWLYLSNDDGGNHVNIAMTSHFGEQGMYIAFDVTESVPIYVNLNRAPTLNSCIELYLAPPHVSKINSNTVFEIDLLPTGDMSFKKSNGKYGYINVETTNDTMAYLGATTKGGEVNTPECYGYVLELYIPWDYMEWLGQDVEAMKNGHVLINPAHITSNNLLGTDHDLDRYWYYYVQQIGTDFSNVSQYFRFDGEGVMGAKEIELIEGEHYSFKGNNLVLPGMQASITIIPEEGYALTSILVDGQEKITRASFNEDGSVTVPVRCTTEEQSISAVAEAVTDGNKTLTGKLIANSVPHENFEGFIVSYVGPTGEKPVKLDSEGNFEIADLTPGFYTLKVETEGYPVFSQGVYVNRDMYVEVVFKTSVFTVTGGTCWILDDESANILYKVNGAGNIISKDFYNDFTFETYVKYDPELAKQSNDDYSLQQRSGARILFSNGKYWHIDLLQENGKYIVQYAKHSGNDSLFGWKPIHTLTPDQAEKYCSEEGIKLSLIRVGNQVAICLEDEVLVVEKLAAEYKNHTAQVGLEAWIANSKMITIPYSLIGSAKLPPAPVTYWKGAATWDVSLQQRGIVYKTGVAGKDTWLDAAVNANDITTKAKDRSPETNDYSMIYIFKFSNGEQFRVRLNHTDTDGKYRIQSMSNSTVFEAWKNHYTLNAEQEELAKTEGINFRVWVYGTTAYVYLEGEQVCTYDLSTVVATGQPSGIDKATVRVSLRIDGNIGKSTAVPFILRVNNKGMEEEKPGEPSEPEKPIDPENLVTLNIAELTNGTVTPDKKAYAVGDTVTLTIASNAGYVQKLYINGQPLLLDYTTGKYSFVATEKTYDITGDFVAMNGWFWTGGWNLLNQGHGIAYAPANFEGTERTGDLVPEQGIYNHVNVLVKDVSHGEQKDYAMVLKMHFVGGLKAEVRLIDRDDNGKYCLQAMGDSFSNWNTLYWLTDAENAAVKDGNGVWYGMTRDGTSLNLLINGNVVKTIDLSAKGIASDTEIDQIKIQAYNFGYAVEVPYEFKKIETANQVIVKIPALTNGTVISDKSGYNLGDTVTLTITPAAGYSQKLYINGQPLLLDWKTNTYRFVATEEVYEITGGFVSNPTVASDAARWDTANQAHGVVSTYYPGNNDSWWLTFNGEYSAIAVTAKNYLPVADSMDGNGQEGYQQLLRMSLSNGKTYAFRVYNDKGTYAVSCTAVSGSVTGWGNWKKISDADAAAMNAGGVQFKIERTAADTIAISVNGVTMFSYKMDGVTADVKVTSVGIQNNGNGGQWVDIPYTLTVPSAEPPVEEDLIELKLPNVANGTVTASKSGYKLGETVTLNVTPADGYAQKLYINGQPLMLDYATGKYSFIATEKTYEITGGFVAKDKWFWTADWNLLNQGHDIAHAPAHSGKDATGELVPEKGIYNHVNVLIKDVSHGDQKDYAIALKMHFVGGLKAEVRLVDRDDNGKYCLQAMGDSFSSWNTLYWLTDAENAAVKDGNGVWYGMTRDGTNLNLLINGNVVKTISMSGKGITADTAIDQIKIQAYNFGYAVDIPYEFKMITVEKQVVVNIPALTNGTVTSDKSGYNLGETVTLNITPADGYAAKLYINGQPLMLDYATGQYSFVATEETYEITGNFVAKEKWFWTADWNLLNQGHGIAHALANSGKEATGELVPQKGLYNYVNVLVKDVSHGDRKDYAIVLKMTFTNGQKAEVRLIDRDDNGKYCLQVFGNNLLGNWATLHWLTDAENAAVKDGSGVWYGMACVGSELRLLINGSVVKTIDLSGNGITEAAIDQIKIQAYNFTYAVDIPYEFRKVAD